jgi:hypothetical protein
MKKIYAFMGQKGENNPSEPKNRTCAPKSVLLCDKSINQVLYEARK